jgi:DNA-binding response OmpR family regulator
VKILIAEDDLTSRFILKGILVKWGHDILIAQDGMEALNKLQASDRPQVAILDWEMPGMDGLEVCRQIKKMELPVPIYTIVLTGRASKEEIVQGLDAGADDYITKPFDTNELKARIRAAERMVRVQETLARKVEDLKEALGHVKLLQGIIPICMHCHKIRNDNQAWDQLEAYISDHSDAQFSHSICPECMKKYYPGYDDEDQMDDR